jgi:hypothetical protein
MNIQNPDIDALRKLIADADDTAGHHIVWLDLDGNVHVSLLVDEFPIEWEKRNENRYKFRLESFAQGNGYVGPEAAKDERHLKAMMAQLKHGWTMPGIGNYEEGA